MDGVQRGKGGVRRDEDLPCRAFDKTRKSGREEGRERERRGRHACCGKVAGRRKEDSELGGLVISNGGGQVIG